MSAADTPREAAFRAEVRAWFDANAPLREAGDDAISVLDALDDEPDALDRARHWQRKLADAGWAAITWPARLGGRDAGPVEAMVFSEELRRYDVPVGVFRIGIGMVGPTLTAHGTPEQLDRYLPPMLDGSEIWCQLWSEPDAGSDLAGLRCRADLDGDEFVINGQKVWTSGAHYSRFGFGLFRSDLDVPKHRGLSAVVVPMDTPGITIRPLKQMNGRAHFNEVFFEDVRVPVANLVGELNGGWTVARTMMVNERLSAGVIASPVAAARAAARLARDHGRVNNRLARQILADVYVRARAFDLTTARVRSALANDQLPGPESSVLKLAAAGVETAVAEAGTSVTGPAAMLAGDDAPEGGRWTQALLGSFAMHIGGGTDEIQRNVIGESALGLPREPAVDKDLPFRELLRGDNAQ